jgi:hypothetical protein
MRASAMRVTHTTVQMPLSPAAFDEIKNKLLEGGYSHVFLSENEMDMTGISVYRYAGNDQEVKGTQGQ